MSKEENVINFYVLCNRLKTLIRTGWQNWRVSGDRLESVAERVYGVQMLAIAMHSEYGYDVDLKKVILMLAVHELEETMIGDYTSFDISKEEKNKLGHVFVSKILQPLMNGGEIKELIFEFDARKTKEALFAHLCDKLECDLQCKIYDEQNMVDITNQDNVLVKHDNNVVERIKEGQTWSQMWLNYTRERVKYDDNFLKISDYALNNKILKDNKNKKA